MDARQLPLYQEKARSIGSNLRHIEIARNSAESRKKSLLKKNSGKFYTPRAIGIPLVKSISKHVKPSQHISVIDPFCGDGRLIVWLLENIGHYPEIDISIWDYDGASVEIARSNIDDASKRLGIVCNISAKQVDTFTEFYKDEYEDTFDVVITNPPWDVIKPDRTELKHMENGEQEEYTLSLKRFSNKLIADYPVSKPNKMYGGWGVNLARVGSEIAIRLAKPHGVVGLVSPASLLADQNSVNLRKWIFQNNHSKEVNYFPAESKLFSDVDADSITLVIIKGGKQDGILLEKYNKDAKSIFKEKLEIPLEFLSTIDYKIPISFGSKPRLIDHLVNFQKLPSFQELQSPKLGALWSGREFDETGYVKWTDSDGDFPFIKGRMVNRFSKVTSSGLYVGKSKIANIPNSAKHHRIVWRDVSRPSQKRRLIATIAPPKHVTGNSLGVAYFKNDNSHTKLYALLGIMSSLVFEFQVRALLATSHISLGVLRKTRIPDFADTILVEELASIVKKIIDGNKDFEDHLEILASKAYGLKEEEFSEIVEAFPKIDVEHRERLISGYRQINI